MSVEIANPTEASNPIRPPSARAESRFQAQETPDELARRLGLPFSDYRLLSRALTHRSYLNENSDAIEDNERLEFLGDAVLDFLVGAWLYNRFPEMREGGLTRLRSALVNTDQLADFARQANLGAALKLGRGEAQGGGRERSALLCATFEALVGALYLNAGLPAVGDFLEPYLSRAAAEILAAQSDQDAKSLLQQAVQARGHQPPQYHTIGAIGPEHEKTFVVEVQVADKKHPDGLVLGRGSGHSKQQAAQEAARQALGRLDELGEAP